MIEAFEEGSWGGETACYDSGVLELLELVGYCGWEKGTNQFDLDPSC